MGQQFEDRRRIDDKRWERLQAFIDRRFIDHEKFEMLIANHMRDMLNRHDRLLVGESGSNGLVGDMKSIKTKLAVYTGIAGALLTIAGILVAL